MLVLVVLAAFFNVLGRPYLQRYAQIRVVSLFMASGWLALTVCSFAAGWADPWPALNRAGWLSLLYIGTVAGALPMFLYHWALGRIEASQVAVSNSISPLSAAFFGVLLLAEPLSWRLGIGLVMVISGIYLVSWRGFQQTTDSEETAKTR
jgi:drug/metabolite transporter (DMT)-like permease